MESSPPTIAHWKGYVLAIVVTLIATAIGAAVSPQVHETNLAMIYILGVVVVASRCDRGPAIFASVLGVAAFDVCFVPPQGTFAVSDVQYLVTFAVMLTVSVVISTLTVKVREQAQRWSSALVKADIEQQRGDLLSGVSHELRTPLATIEGSAGALLRQSELSEQSRQLAGTIQDESERMSQLVQSPLDVSRVQGSFTPDLDWYGLDELGANAIERATKLFERPPSLEIASTFPLLLVDGVIIEQVLFNLLENAARHAGAQATVYVLYSVEGDQAVVRVEDDGPGIQPGAEATIFDRFESSKGPGFGLGLAFCRAAVLAHGGTIEAEPHRVAGAAIVVRLPISQKVAR